MAAKGKKKGRSSGGGLFAGVSSAVRLCVALFLLAVLVLSVARSVQAHGGFGGYFRYLSETGKSLSASALCTMQGGSMNECWDTPRVSPPGSVASPSDDGSGSSSSSDSSSSSSNASGSDSGSSSASAPGSGSREDWLRRLDALPSGEADTSVPYNRKDYKHWIAIQGACDTRETALVRDGSDVVTDPSTCKVTSGSWVDPYSGETFTDAKKMDIDHLIPLQYAHQHGGASWDAAKKQAYANDLDTVLLTVSARENRSKGAAGPGEYMPPLKSYRCEYSQRWVAVSEKYGLTVGKADRQALNSGLSSCQ